MPYEGSLDIHVKYSSKWHYLEAFFQYYYGLRRTRLKNKIRHTSFSGAYSSASFKWIGESSSEFSSLQLRCKPLPECFAQATQKSYQAGDVFSQVPWGVEGLLREFCSCALPAHAGGSETSPSTLCVARSLPGFTVELMVNMETPLLP